MGWESLLRLPSTVLLLLAVLALLWALLHLFKMWRRIRGRRRVAAGWHGLLLLVASALGLLLAGLGTSLYGYRFLGQEQPVLQLTAHALEPQRWQLTLTWPDGHTRQIVLAGDDFRVDALVLKWKLPAVLAGIPPVYRLDRLQGRYEDIGREMRAPRTVVDLHEPTAFDLFGWSEQHPRWLFQVDTIYGSGVYLPLTDGGHYTIHLMRTGALVARKSQS